MHFTVLNSKPVSREICEKHQPPLVNYMPTTRQWEIKNQGFGRQYTVCFPWLFKLSKHGSIKGKIIWKRSEGKQRLFQVSGRFELPRVKLQ